MSVYALCEVDMWPHILWGPHVNLDSLNIFSYSWHGSYGKHSQFFSYHFQPSQSQQLQCLFSLLRYMTSFGMNIKGLSEMLEYWPLLTLIISRIWVQWKLKKEKWYVMIINVMIISQHSKISMPTHTWFFFLISNLIFFCLLILELLWHFVVE